MTLHDFLRYHTDVGDVVVIVEEGWQIGVTMIDHEDLFLRSLHPDMLDNEVKSYSQSNHHRLGEVTKVRI